MIVVYFGFNDPRSHARGVEFVILAQSTAAHRAYYIFLSHEAAVFRWHGVLCIGLRRSIGWPLTLNLLLARLRRNGARRVLVHAHHYLMAAVLWRRADLFTVHDGLAYLKAAMGNSSRRFALIEAWVYLRVRAIHFISAYSRSMAHPAHKWRRNFLISNTCTRELLHQSLDATSVAPWPRPYILIVRSIEERAGLALVLDVAEKLQGAECAIDIVIAGKGPLLDLYRAQVARRCLNHVHLLGYIDDARLDQLYEQCELVVTPALYGEGFGLPVVEAYYFGKRCLASSVCALPEVVCAPTDLFENTVESMSNLLQAALAKVAVPGPERRAQANGYRDYYQRMFGVQRYTDAFRTIYEEALSERG